MHLRHIRHQQQGYHGSRVSRQEGTHRRVLETDTNECVDVVPIERKEEQCIRLAECANSYRLYDMFIFEFGDDIDIETGKADTNIKAYDEKQLRDKVRVWVKLPLPYMFFVQAKILCDTPFLLFS